LRLRVVRAAPERVSRRDLEVVVRAMSAWARRWRGGPWCGPARTAHLARTLPHRGSRELGAYKCVVVVQLQTVSRVLHW